MPHEPRTADRYALFYPPLALGIFVLAFLPLFQDTIDDGIRSSYGTVFQMAGRPGGGPAIIGLLLLFGVVGQLVALTLRPPRSAGPPAATAVVAALVALLLITKPGTGRPVPHLTDSGTAGLVLAVCAVVLAAAHAIHLTLLPKRPVSSGVRPPEGALP